MRFLLFFTLVLPALLFSIQRTSELSGGPNYFIHKVSDESDCNLQIYIPQGFMYDVRASDGRCPIYFRMTYDGEETFALDEGSAGMTLQECFNECKSLQIARMEGGIDEIWENVEEKNGIMRKDLFFSGVYYIENRDGKIEKLNGLKHAAVISFLQHQGSDKVFIVAQNIVFPAGRKSRPQIRAILKNLEESANEHVVLSKEIVEPKNWTKDEELVTRCYRNDPFEAIVLELFEDPQKKLQVSFPKGTVFHQDDPGSTVLQMQKDGKENGLLFASLYPAGLSLKEFSSEYLSLLPKEGLNKKLSLTFSTKDGFPIGEINSEKLVESEDGELKKVLGHFQVFQGEKCFLVVVSIKVFPKDISSEETKKAFSEMREYPRYEVVLPESLVETSEQTGELPPEGSFSMADGKLLQLQGKIENGRYLAAKNVFSCRADDFGKGEYIAQDGLSKDAACAAFYSTRGDFRKAEVLFMPMIEKRTLGEKALKFGFERFGIEILKEVDNAQGIEVLEEEMIAEDMFFAAISVEKMSVLRDAAGKNMSSTRGYLVFQSKDKLVVLSNQEVTLPDQKHDPRKHIEKLKEDILEYRKTFEFGQIPILSEETFEEAG